MSNCCCTSIYNAGCINPCNGLTISNVEVESLTVTIEHAGRTWQQTVEVQENNAVIYLLNESGVHLIHFPAPLEIEGETYDCIQVTTKIYTNGIS